MTSLVRKQFKQRCVDEKTFKETMRLGFTELQAKIVAGRAITKPDNLDKILTPSLKNLHHPELLQDAPQAAKYLAQAIDKEETIGILTDYDVDGICSHVVIMESLKLFGVPEESMISLIGHRINDGYGVSENLVDRILTLKKKPELIITADCGSSDEDQIKRLRENEIRVIVTDHHAIPQEGIPLSAVATVNPTRIDCNYPDKLISGCMVSWLLMCLLRNVLIEKKKVRDDVPKLGNLLDYVGLSTVADAVSLFNSSNRAVVKTGLSVMNDLSKPSWIAMKNQFANGGDHFFTAEDLAFKVGPRINARSRVADPYAALHFFMANNTSDADNIIRLLEKSNNERRDTEQKMVEIAMARASQSDDGKSKSLVISDDKFHVGVQGIVASRLVDAFGKPSVVFSPVSDGEVLSGSARTIPDVHIRNVLQRVHDKNQGLLLTFGGHKGAAGLKIEKNKVSLFRKAFDDEVSAEVGGKILKLFLFTDGDISEDKINLKTYNELKELEPYGREFEEPLFEGVFYVSRCKLVGNEAVHLSMDLISKKEKFPAIWFRAVSNQGDAPPIKPGDTIRCAYKLKQNQFRGKRNLQLFIEYAEPFNG